MDTVDFIIKSATTFYEELRVDSNGQNRSWEHCYKYFHDARNNPAPDYDYLSLQLAFYLTRHNLLRNIVRPYCEHHIIVLAYSNTGIYNHTKAFMPRHQ